jgi:hypothetical protein
MEVYNQFVHRRSIRTKTKLTTNKHIYSRMSSIDQLPVDMTFFNLIDLNPNRRETVNNDVFVELIATNPKLCHRKYQFPSSFDGDWLYPLHVICALNASLDTVKACYKAYPDAILHHSVSIGGPIHYACYYGATLDVIKYLTKKDTNSLEQANIAQGKTPLHLVCSNCDRNPYRLDTLCFLTERCPNAAAMTDVNGSTPLNVLCTLLQDNESNVQILNMVEDLTEVCPNAGIVKAKDNTWPLWNALDNKHDIQVNYTAIIKDLIVSNVECTKLMYQTDEEEEYNECGTSILHRAIQMDAPMSIVKDILRAHPKGCIVPDTKGRIPLFYLLTEKESPSLALIQLLVHQAPETIDFLYDNEIPHTCAQRLQLHPDIVSFLNPYEE